MRITKPDLVAAWVVFTASMVAIVTQAGGWGLTVLYGEGALLTMGTLLVLRRPGNAIGAILITMGTMWAIILAADATVETIAIRGHEALASWIALGFMMATFPMLWLGNILIWLVFPHGRTSTRHSRTFIRVTGAATLALTALAFFSRPRILGPGEPEYPHPFLPQDVGNDVGTVVDAVTVPLLFLGGFVAAGMLFARSRHSDSIERRQIGWVALGYIISNVLLLGNAFLQPLGPAGETEADRSIDSLAFLVIAVTLGVAIMRYRLYDIDLIVSKSVMYLGLLAAITAVYAAVVVVPLLVIGADNSGDGPGLLLPILATGVVALLFEPIRARMQRWANRLVYGNRATPHEVLSRVTSRLADSEGQSTDDLARIVAEGTGAEHAVIWLNGADCLTPAGHWPADGTPLSLPATEDVCTAIVEVRHEADVLGAVAIKKPNNDTITPADRELLGDLAASAALTLRNIRLNKALEDRAVEVRQSRRRLIEAQDTERHRLERDLHDGAQQQVVALKVKLGIAKTVAQRESAADIAARLVGLAADTQEAVDALRLVAHGIYPPLLESEGLEPALRAVERTSGMPVQLTLVDIERYGRGTEETVYFCVTETLERARMSGATNARVELAGRNGDLIAAIDLGSSVGKLDLTAVADRLDAAGGTLTIEDQPAQGRYVVGSLPIAHPEGATS